MKLHFKWDHKRGEARAKKGQLKALKAALSSDAETLDNITALDFLRDIIEATTSLYDNALRDAKIAAEKNFPLHEEDFVVRETKRKGKSYHFVNGRKTGLVKFSLLIKEAVEKGWLPTDQPTHIEDAGNVRLWKFRMKAGE